MEDSVGCVIVDTYPQGAKIYVDNTLVVDDSGDPGLTPAKLTMTEGMHNIIFELDGYMKEFATVYVMQDEIQNVYKYFNVSDPYC